MQLCMSRSGGDSTRRGRNRPGNLDIIRRPCIYGSTPASLSRCCELPLYTVLFFVLGKFSFSVSVPPPCDVISSSSLFLSDSAVSSDLTFHRICVLQDECGIFSEPPLRCDTTPVYYPHDKPTELNHTPHGSITSRTK